MKVFYASDLHGDLGGLEKWVDYVKKQNPDFFLVSGDLVDGMYAKDSQKDRVFDEARKYMIQTGQRYGVDFEKISLDGLANAVLNTPETTKEEKGASRVYLRLWENAEEGLREQYEKVKDILSDVNIDYAVLPGNYDSDKLLEEILEDKSIHKTSLKNEQGVKISGYGGASAYASFAVPMEHIVNYGSEFDVYRYFKTENPDIAVVHNPPYGACDFIETSLAEGIADNRHVGSAGLAAFVREKQPKIVLSGHIHGDYGVQKLGRSYVVNPGRFGRAKKGDIRGGSSGTFYELEIDDDTGRLVNADLYKMDFETGEVAKLDSMENEKPLSMEVYKPQTAEGLESLEDALEGEQAQDTGIEAVNTEAKPKAKAELSKVPYHAQRRIKALENRLKEYENIPAYGRKLGVLESYLNSFVCDKSGEERSIDKISRGKRKVHDAEVMKYLRELDESVYKMSKEHPELKAYSEKIVSLAKMVKDADPKQNRDSQISYINNFVAELQQTLGNVYKVKSTDAEKDSKEAGVSEGTTAKTPGKETTSEKAYGAERQNDYIQRALINNPFDSETLMKLAYV